MNRDAQPPDGGYHPRPIDTSAVALPEHLEALAELLAENTHETWAKRRVEEGWTHGPQRDENLKTTPCLVPYADLPEAEKDYDRSTAQETIRLLLAVGYEITAPKAEGAPLLTAPAKSVASVRGAIADEQASLDSLALVWNSRSHTVWAQHAELFRELASRFLALGHTLLAYDVVRTGLEYHSDEPTLLILMATVRCRMGEDRDARRLCRRVLRQWGDNGRAAAQLASAYKIGWRKAPKSQRRRVHLLQAIRQYERAFELSGECWPAINAATLHRIVGDEAGALRWAEQTLRLCRQESERELSDDDAYWLDATLAEAHAVRGDWSAALERYAAAAASPTAGLGRLASTRRQALLLAREIGGPVEELEAILLAPRVILFSGHMIDAPGRPAPRFPESLAAEIKRRLAARLAGEGPIIGITSAASGADLLFLETLLDDYADRSEAYLVLPFGKAEFREMSVAPAGEHWLDRFEEFTQRAHHAGRLQVLSPQKMGDGTASFIYANDVMLGMALQIADRYETRVTPLTVWDGQPGKPGGAGANVELWRRHALPVEVIEVPPDCPKAPTPSAANAAADPTGSGSERVMAMMFADVKGFSKLEEPQVPRFVEAYMGLAARVLSETGVELSHINTWGDAIYFVCESVRDAGVTALRLTRRLRREHWRRHGLPDTLGIRCALHAGPVVRVVDPVTGSPNYVGSHVSRAARIEPITPVNQVYASQAFAALARLDGVTDFSCEYVGMAPLAKGYGVLPTYRVMANEPLAAG